MERLHQKPKKTQQAPSSFTPRSSLVQHTCACEGVAGIDDLCEQCRSQRLSGQRGAHNPLKSSWPISLGHDVPDTSQQPIEATQQSSGGFHFGHDFSRIPVHAAFSGPIQAKLSISQPKDRQEQEADQVAEQVMRMTDLGPSILEDEDEAKPSLMRKHSSELQTDTGADLSSVPDAIDTMVNSEAAQPLDRATRAFMEPRFGHDFSKVRVHTDVRAAESARAVNALAYTVGRDIVFGEGQYAPGTDVGRQLLAHELTHTIQQAKVPPSVPLQPLPSESSDKQEPPTYCAAKTLLGPSHAELHHNIRSILQNSTITQPRLALKADPNVIHKLNAAAIRKHPDYIDNNIVSISFSGSLRATSYYADGTELTIGLVPRWIEPPLESVDYRRTKYEYAEVKARDPKELKFLYTSGPSQEGTLPGPMFLEKYAKTVTFTVDPRSGKIVPNHLNPVTAPKLCELLRYAESQWVKHGNEEAKGRVEIFKSVKVVLDWALTLETMGGLKAPAGLPTPGSSTLRLMGKKELAEMAERMAQQMAAKYGKVLVNLGGAGEVANAINVNPLIAQRVKDIPNLVRAGAEEVGSLFKPGTVDKIVSNDIVRGTVNWSRATRGSFSILKSGGQVSIAPYAADLTQHLREIQAALRAAGFKDVVVVANRFVTAVKP